MILCLVSAKLESKPRSRNRQLSVMRYTETGTQEPAPIDTGAGFSTLDA